MSAARPPATSPTSTLFAKTTLSAKDRTPIAAFSCGSPDLPTVVLVNAFAMPVTFWEPFARRLLPAHRLLTWESRGVPDTSVAFDPARCGVADHVDDLCTVLDAFGVERARLVGWCSGAQIALRFAATYPARAEALALLAGAYRLSDDVPRSDFFTRLLTFLPSCARSARQARLYATMFGFARGPNGPSNPEPGGNELDTNIPETLRHMTDAPFLDGEALFRYAHLQLRFLEEPTDAWTSGVTARTLVVGSEKDAIVHPSSSSIVARLLKHSELVMLKDADHYAHYFDASVAETVRRFFDNERTPS
jgi:pimeloyl-ACP methyl ester carboxylesterase